MFPAGTLSIIVAGNNGMIAIFQRVLAGGTGIININIIKR
jgi:hypothetical protein